MGKVKLKQSTPSAVKNQLRHSGVRLSTNAAPLGAIDNDFTRPASTKIPYQNRYSS